MANSHSLNLHARLSFFMWPWTLKTVCGSHGLWDRPYMYGILLLFAKTRKSKHLQLSLTLQRHHFRIIYFKTLTVSLAWVWTHILSQGTCSLELYELSQHFSVGKQRDWGVQICIVCSCWRWLADLIDLQKCKTNRQFATVKSTSFSLQGLGLTNLEKLSWIL